MEQTKQPLDWDTVYWEHMPKVFRYFCYQVGDKSLAEDLTATTFVKAWKARGRYDPTRSAVTTWLMTIARNTVTDYYRRERATLSLESAEETSTEMPSIEEVLEQSQNLARLAELLGKLSPRERELIALKYGAGMTNRSAAQLLGISESNVGTTLYRAVNWLRSAWEVSANE